MVFRTGSGTGSGSGLEYFLNHNTQILCAVRVTILINLAAINCSDTSTGKNLTIVIFAFIYKTAFRTGHANDYLASSTFRNEQGLHTGIKYIKIHSQQIYFMELNSQSTLCRMNCDWKWPEGFTPLTGSRSMVNLNELETDTRVDVVARSESTAALVDMRPVQT